MDVSIDEVSAEITEGRDANASSDARPPDEAETAPSEAERARDWRVARVRRLHDRLRAF